MEVEDYNAELHNLIYRSECYVGFYKARMLFYNFLREIRIEILTFETLCCRAITVAFKSSSADM